jgi:UDP-N-acetyl-2-amino-2-deoxyglucuronate dehydrogenase
MQLPIRFALIGLGRISYKHITHLKEIEDATITCVCDINEKKAIEKSKELKVPYYTDYHQMLADESDNIDVVAILTPSGSHPQITVDVAAAGKHIVAEKPMALHLDDADKMIQQCDKAGVQLFVVKQNRFNLPVKKLREAIENSRFGKMVMGTVRVRWSRDQKYYDMDEWRGTWAQDGGVFTNQASHHIDLLQWMMGPIESVFAKTETQLVNIEVEDTGVVVLKFVNGALGIIEATTATRPKDLEGSVSIMGEKGTVEIGGFAVNQMRVWKFADAADNEEEEILKTFGNNPPNVYGYGHKEYLEHVVETLKSGKQSFLDGFEGRKSLEIINAIYESVETGKEVFLRFNPSKCKLARTL